MNVIERLSQSAQVNHGLQLQPTQVKELVTILQGMQMQIASDQGRGDALTRILAVALNHIGGAIDIEPDLFADAEHYAVHVEWDEEEEGAIIHVTLTRSSVDLPEVSDDDEAAGGSGEGAVRLPEPNSGRPQDVVDTDGHEED